MITKLEAHRYTLKPRVTGAAARPGALIRVTFSDVAATGMADLFPWKEFGDPALETWLSNLATLPESELPKTLKIALQAAHDDAVSAARGEPLVQGSIVNHWLATDPVDLAVFDVMEARRASSPAMKIKIGKRDLVDEAAALSRLNSHWGLKLRLDANERSTREGLLRFLDALPIRMRDSIEFIEDPFTFDLRAWSEFHRETGIAIAYDRGVQGEALDLNEVFSENAAQILVHKPAWQDEARAISARERNVPLVVTSILGHPVGNLWAAAKAAQLAPEGVHGCMSHVAYRDDDATMALVKSKQVRGSRVVGIGVGLGLQSKWLNRLKWEPLK